jgi:molybdopterin-synthase adenylyltransferase
MPADHPPRGCRRVDLPVDPHLRGADLRITELHWNTLTEHLLGDGREQSALLICGVRDFARGTDTRAGEGDRQVTYLVHEVVLLGEGDYLDRGALHLSVAPAALARHAKLARRRDSAVVLVHSHPFSGRVVASSIDLTTEADLCRRVLPARTGRPSAALVIGPNGVDARAWTEHGAAPLHTVHVLGDQITRFAATSYGLPDRREHHAITADPIGVGTAHATTDPGATARQELLWGKTGQQILAGSRVVVVGAGGTGSHILTQLAHLRVGHLTVIDGDVVETTNLSRLIGATPGDVNHPKVDVLAAHLRAIHPGIHVTSIQASVLDVDPAVYTGSDLVVCATDGHGSRSLLTEVSTQYLVPLVDLGVEIVPGLTDISSDVGHDSDSGANPCADAFRAGGGVRVLRPGRGCLWCAGNLSPELVRREYLDPDQRAREIARGYVRDVDNAEPSVVALNGVVASLAVLEICQLLVGVLGSGRTRLLFRAERRSLTTAAIARRDTCHVCGDVGVLGRGDAVRVKTRWRYNRDGAGVRRLG